MVHWPVTHSACSGCPPYTWFIYFNIPALYESSGSVWALSGHCRAWYVTISFV